MPRATRQILLRWLQGFTLLALFSGAALTAQARQAPPLAAANDGIAIDAGTFGHFTLTYPELDAGQSETLKPIERTVAGGRARSNTPGTRR